MIFPETAGELRVALKTFNPVSPVTLNRLNATKSCVFDGDYLIFALSESITISLPSISRLVIFSKLPPERVTTYPFKFVSPLNVPPETVRSNAPPE